MSDWIQVLKDPHDLESVEHQTEGMRLDALKKESFVLKFVKNQSKEICLAAVNLPNFKRKPVNQRKTGTLSKRAK